MSRAKVGRVTVWVDCECGDEVEFDDAEVDVSSESQPCDNCGRIVEISGLSVEVRTFEVGDDVPKSG